MSENWHSGCPIGIYDSKCIMHYNVKTHLCKLVSKVGWPIFMFLFQFASQQKVLQNVIKLSCVGFNLSRGGQ